MAEQMKMLHALLKRLCPEVLWEFVALAECTCRSHQTNQPQARSRTMQSSWRDHLICYRFCRKDNATTLQTICPWLLLHLVLGQSRRPTPCNNAVRLLALLSSICWADNNYQQVSQIHQITIISLTPNDRIRFDVSSQNSSNSASSRTIPVVSIFMSLERNNHTWRTLNACFDLKSSLTIPPEISLKNTLGAGLTITFVPKWFTTLMSATEI